MLIRSAARSKTVKKLKMANVLKMAMMTAQGTAEIYQIEKEMVVLSSSNTDVCCLNETEW